MSGFADRDGEEGLASSSTITATAAIDCVVGDAHYYYVLLYYVYVDIPNVNEVVKMQTSWCEELGLLGRIRVSDEGINGTVDGTKCNLDEYIRRMQAWDVLLKSGIAVHWKVHPYRFQNHSNSNETYLANQGENKDENDTKSTIDASEGINGGCSIVSSSRVYNVVEGGEGVVGSKENSKKKSPSFASVLSRFSSLSVKKTKEVVSLDITTEEIARLKDVGPGKYLSPQEFHSELLQGDDNLVVIDVRNAYESKIGRFEWPTPDGRVRTPVDPNTRQFGDFIPSIDKNIDELKDKKVLMYCTGGVRCERASAYLKLRGIEEVFHLFGGIVNYQDQYPEGGFFRGKNFVYDPRGAVAAERNPDDVIGSCLVCSSPFDDYSAKVRCSRCRVLILVCDACRAEVGVCDGDGDLLSTSAAAETTFTCGASEGGNSSSSSSSSRKNKIELQLPVDLSSILCDKCS